MDYSPTYIRSDDKHRVERIITKNKTTYLCERKEADNTWSEVRKVHYQDMAIGWFEELRTDTIDKT